jgi:SAM-dependent methyltransferase
MSDFETVFSSLANVNGWMTRDQAQRLWNRAGELEAGATVVEIGSFQGRSMCVLASSAAPGVTLVAIDPHGGNDRGPQEIDGFAQEAESDHQIFLTNLTNAGVRDRVTYLRKYANDAFDDVPGDIDLLYVDGAHRFAPASDDIKKWGKKLKPGGRLLVHDSFSSIGVTLALMTITFWSSQWIYEGRSQSMAQFRRGPNTFGQRMGSLAAQLSQLPYFVKNLIYKVLLSAKLKPLAKALGSTGEWPY